MSNDNLTRNRAILWCVTIRSCP